MRANCSATSEEIDISLSKDEINSLENRVLKGFLAIPSEKGRLVKPLNLKIGEIHLSSEFSFVEIRHNPPYSNYLESKSFDIIISKDSYQYFKETGALGEEGHGRKIMIYELKPLSKTQRFLHE